MLQSVRTDGEKRNVNRRVIFLAAIFASAYLVEPCAAQNAQGRVGIPVSDQNSRSAGYASALNSPWEQAKEQEFLQKRSLLGLSPEQLRAQDKAAATELVTTFQLPCDVTSAQLRLEGSEKIDGISVKSQTYETACNNGLGYLLVGRGQPGRPYGITCFAADATREADLKAHKQPDIFCTLPENQDVKATAANILLRKGKSCVVRAVRWVGVSPTSNTDYTEIACNDGNGYVLASPMPGSKVIPQLVKCHDAAVQGIICKMSDNGVKIVTVQTFKDALTQHHVACDASGVRVIGKETVTKRHVVEFLCKEHPEGLIAYIPLDDNPTPFETMDCATAAKRGLACNLTPVK
jgi:hypothetical protein